jgi:hypothetical protein
MSKDQHQTLTKTVPYRARDGEFALLRRPDREGAAISEKELIRTDFTFLLDHKVVEI